MVKEPVEQADGGGVLGQEPAPGFEGPVAGDAQRAAFAGGRDHAEQQLRAGVIQRREPHPGDFPGLGTLSYTLLAFVNRYNRTAQPFNWKFTADDLTALLHRISQREQAPASQQPDLPQAA